MGLMPVPVGLGTFQRPFAQAPEIRMVNRFFERVPTNPEGAALITRPGFGSLDVGIEPFGAYTVLFTQPGVFGGDLFIATSHDGLFRYSAAGVLQAISDSDDIGLRPSFAASVGLYHANLFIASEDGLGYYDSRSRARAFLRRDPGPAKLLDQTVRVGSVYYKWRDAASVDAGTPDGTALNPYLLNHDNGSALPGFEDHVALSALAAAVNANGVPGTDYSSALNTPNADIRADGIDDPINLSGYLYFTALAEDVGANALELEVVSGTGLFIGTPDTAAVPSPDTVNFSGGGAHAFHVIDVPDDAAVSKVAALNSYALVMLEGSQQFYFIRPGEVAIDALNFFSAESLPDEIRDALVIGDLVWFFGSRSTEAWFATGSSDRPFQRMAGMTFSVGAVRNTAVEVNGKGVFVGSDSCVYVLQGAPQRISNHGIEERIRRAIADDDDMEAWSFFMDGHHFYVLAIDSVGTFVFDDVSGEWSHWYSTVGNPEWGFIRGIVWGSRIVGTDPDGVALWELDQDAPLDSGTPIPRIVTGFLPHRDTAYATLSFLRVYGSIGKPDITIPPLPSLSLRFSDDNGETWQGPFTVELSTSEQQDVAFRSLGRVGIPGRIIELSDTGGLRRIDGVYAQID